MTLTIQTTGANSPRFELGGKPIQPQRGVKALMAEIGFTHAELARACGASLTTSYGWASGRKPSDGALFKMAHLLSAHRTLSQGAK